MASKLHSVSSVDVHQVAAAILSKNEKVLIIDCRSFLEFNDCHIVNAVNIHCSKLMKRRLLQGKVLMKDVLLNSRIEAEESWDAIVYDHGTPTLDTVSIESFLFVLLKKLVPLFHKVHFLAGGFLEFQAAHPNLCEDKVCQCLTLTSLSQPCLPIANVGPTRILPFLYLGSEEDSNNRDLLESHNISFELNVSTNCPKPEFIQDSNFLRIPVNDSHNERLLPHFIRTCQFIDKAREASGCVLVHCLAGISRSPTVAIAYVMKYLRLPCEDAYRYVKSKRATISPNFNFLGQLLEYEKQLKEDLILENKKEKKSVVMTSESASTIERKVCEQHLRQRSSNLNLPLTMLPQSQQPRLSDLSPTTALSRLHFDPLPGKENWYSSDKWEEDRTSWCWEKHSHMSLSVCGTGTQMRSSVTTVMSQHDIQGYRGASSTLSDISFVPCKTAARKTEETLPAVCSNLSPPVSHHDLPCSHSQILSWEDRNLLRSDSVCTSGIGSELSDADSAIERQGIQTGGNETDDGVFCDSLSSISPQLSPSCCSKDCPHNCHSHSQSPRVTRKPQLWREFSSSSCKSDNSASLHLSLCSASDGPQDKSSVKSHASDFQSALRSDTIRSPEKRKSSEIPLSPEHHKGSEKRRSYVSIADPCECLVDLKRQSSSPESKDSASGDSFNAAMPSNSGVSYHIRECTCIHNKENNLRDSKENHGAQQGVVRRDWTQTMPAKTKSTSIQNILPTGLYRVNSCPSSIDAGDIRPNACTCIASCRMRDRNQNVLSDPRVKFRYRLSCGSIDYGHLRKTEWMLSDLTNHSDSGCGNTSTSAVISVQ